MESERQENMKEKKSDGTLDSEHSIYSAQYRSMKKLMAIMGTKSFDNIEEYSKLVEYFPSLGNRFPEYNAITQAYVSAFNDTRSARAAPLDFRKGDSLAPLQLHKQYTINSFISSLRRAAQRKPKVVKLSSAKVAPINSVGEENMLSNKFTEEMCDYFCVESYKAARIRRLKLKFPDCVVRKDQAGKVAPYLFRSKTRDRPIRTENDYTTLAALFCVENEMQAYARRLNERNASKKTNKYREMLKCRESCIRPAQINQISRKQYASPCVFKGLEENVKLALTDIDEYSDELEFRDLNEMKQLERGINDKRNGTNKGKISIYVKSIRKLFKKKV